MKVKKEKWNKLLMALSVAAVILFVAACGNDGGDTNDVTNNTNNSSENEEPTTGDEVVIEVWGMGSEGDLLTGMIDMFEAANPGIRVNVTSFPWSDGFENTTTAVIAQSGPDIIQIGSSWFPQFADAGGFLDLTNYFDDSSFAYLDRDNFFEGALEGAVFNGRNYGVPWYVETRVLFYRNDLLEEVGFNGPPTTHEELREAATLLRDHSGHFGMDMNIVDSQTLHIVANSNGVPMVDSKTRTANFAHPVLIEAMEFYASFFEDEIVSMPGVMEMDIVQAFAEGIRPMFISGPWMVNSFENAIAEGAVDEFDWTIAVLPSGSVGNTSFLGGAHLVATSWTNHPQEVVAFLDFMSNPDVQVDWFEMSNTLPAVTPSWNHPLLAENEKLAVFGNQLNDAQGPSVIVEHQEIEARIVYALERIIVGGDDITEAFNRLNAEAQEILDR